MLYSTFNSLTGFLFPYYSFLLSLFVMQTTGAPDLSSGWIPVIANGGIGITMFIVWMLQFKSNNAMQQEWNKQQQLIMAQLVEIIKEDTKYKELLAGILTRTESKLDKALEVKNYIRHPEVNKS